MKIKDFIEHFNMLADEDIDAFLKQTITTTYVPFIEKADACMKIINDSWYRKNEITDKKELHITSPATYILSVMVIINKYTSLEVDFKNTIAEYDLLNNGNYLGMLLAYIPENEQKEFKAWSAGIWCRTCDYIGDSYFYARIPCNLWGFNVDWFFYAADDSM